MFVVSGEKYFSDFNSGIMGCKIYSSFLQMCSCVYVSVLKHLQLFYFSPLCLSSFLGFSVLVERRSFWLSGLHHCLLHQKRGDRSCGGAAQDLPAGGAGQGKQTNQQQQSDTK